MKNQVGVWVTLEKLDILKCRFVIFDPSHYRDDGSCKCDDKAERKRMIRDWEYTKDDFKGIPLRKAK